MIAALLIVGTVMLQRLLELSYAARNTRVLLARGAVEFGRRHYPLIVLLHFAWLLTIVMALPDPLVIHWIPLGIFLLLQIARVWVIASLGPYWTTRIITLDSAPLVRRGPYRFMRHPNYAIVVGEIAALPLAFGEVWVAFFFTIANGAILLWRVRQEEQALAPRRGDTRA